MKALDRSSLLRRAGQRGFLLNEILTVVAIFSLLVLATVASQLFGLRMYRISQSKLTITADARSVLNHMRDEVRSGKYLYIGTGSSDSFTPVAGSSAQAGNVLRICATADTNNYVDYFRDEEDSCLKRVVSGSSETQVLARYVTNEVVFQAEDFQGNVLTNALNNRVVKVTLQFLQPAYPVASQPNGGKYECYQLQTSISRRSID
jgi:hypothetical protein